MTSFLLRFRHVLFIAALITSVVAIGWGPERKQNHSIDGMFAMDDQLHQSYEALKRTFGGNEVILAVYSDPQLFTEAGQGRQEILANRMNDVKGLSGEVMSIDRLTRMIKELNVERYRLLLQFAGFDLTTPKLIESTRELFAGYTHSKDGATAALVVLLESKQVTGISRGKIVADLRSAIDEAEAEIGWVDQVQLIGEPVMVADGFRMVQSDGERLGWVATITLMGVVLICFRSLRWTIIPAVVVQFSLLISKTVIAIIGVEVTIVGSMSTAIITVIAVSTTVHLIIRIRQAMDRGDDYYKATESALRQLSLPITFACLTDTIGFASLWFAELEPVQDFATVMVIGSLLVLLSFWILVPGMALLKGLDRIPFWNLRASRTRLKDVFTSLLERPLRWGHRYPFFILSSVVLLLLFSVIGIRLNTIESDFTKNFRPDSKLVTSYRFVEENLGGAGVWDIMVPVPEKMDIPFLTRIAKLQNRLRNEVQVSAQSNVPSDSSVNLDSSLESRRAGLTKVLSLVDAIESISGKTIDQFSPAYLQVGLTTFEKLLPAFRNSLLNTDPELDHTLFYRIMLRSPERTTSSEKREVISKVRQICDEEFPPATVTHTGQIEEPKITGFYVLLTFMIDSVLRDQWFTFAIAASGIIIALSLLFGDLRLAIIGLIPNMLPVLFVMGLLGWLGIPLNLGIALIAAVAVGLSIDSSVHYIIEFQRSRQGGDAGNAREAISMVQGTVGRALVYSTMALVLGFLSLCFSDFLPTVYFGMTAMIAMVGGLIGNLLLLPMMISWMYPAKKECIIS